MIVETPGDHFIRGFCDQARLLFVQLAEIAIHERGGFFQNPEGVNQLGRHCVTSDIEMVERALGLGAPIPIGRNFDRPHAVGFEAFGGGHQFYCVTGAGFVCNIAE